jgi:hypothetical protein
MTDPKVQEMVERLQDQQWTWQEDWAKDATAAAAMLLALSEELKAWESPNPTGGEFIVVTRKELNRLREENDSLRADARRYRWLRWDCTRASEIIDHYNAASPEWIDAAIDAQEPGCS